MFTSGVVRALKTVKTVSDNPGACLDKPAVKEQNQSSINDNEPSTRGTGQV